MQEDVALFDRLEDRRARTPERDGDVLLEGRVLEIGPFQLVEPHQVRDGERATAAVHVFRSNPD